MKKIVAKLRCTHCGSYNYVKNGIHKNVQLKAASDTIGDMPPDITEMDEIYTMV